MDLNRIVDRVERELAAAFPALKIRSLRADGDVYAQAPDIEDDLIAALVHLVRKAQAQVVQVATGFRPRNAAAGVDVLEFSVLTVTMVSAGSLAKRAVAREEKSAALQLLMQSVESARGKLEFAAAGVSCLRLTICLPYCDQDAGELGGDKSAGETVLLVEDQDLVRGITREVLEMAGYRVLEAADGETAIAVFNQNRGLVDLVLTDVEMPGMSGRDLAEQLAARRPTLKTLFMSGYSEETVLRRGQDCASYLQKPFAVETLTEKVREVLRMPGEPAAWSGDVGADMHSV